MLLLVHRTRHGESYQIGRGIETGADAASTSTTDIIINNMAKLGSTTFAIALDCQIHGGAGIPKIHGTTTDY